MARTKTSKAWLMRHVNDTYVQQAQKAGYRARAAYKLIEINDKDQLLKGGMVVVDLGSAPGSWAQVAISKVGEHGRVIALDILPMATIPGVEFIQGDFREQEVLQQLTNRLDGQAIDLVICDIAPNMSGNPVIDQPRMMLLVEIALDFALQHLKPGGNFLVKIFQGSGFQAYLQFLRRHFEQVVTRKPKASRDESSEIYLLAKRRRTGGETESALESLN
jgi:23S rRNA (uridine2552-2'-O)-methyltransferase